MLIDLIALDFGRILLATECANAASLSAIAALGIARLFHLSVINMRIFFSKFVCLIFETLNVLLLLAAQINVYILRVGG